MHDGRMVHLDTNFLIQATIPGSLAHGLFSSWCITGEAVNISAIVWAEFLCGPLEPMAEQIACEIFPNPEVFLSVDSKLAAGLFNKTGRRSRSLADCMIAAVAIRCQASLATINRTDFKPFVMYGLTLA